MPSQEWTVWPAHLSPASQSSSSVLRSVVLVPALESAPVVPSPFLTGGGERQGRGVGRGREDVEGEGGGGQREGRWKGRPRE